MAGVGLQQVSCRWAMAWGAAGANVLGAGVKYNVNKNFSIGLNVEGIWYNNKTPVYFDQYNYPGRTD